MYRRSLEGSSAEAAKEIEKEAVDSAKGVVTATENAVKAAGEKAK